MSQINPTRHQKNAHRLIMLLSRVVMTVLSRPEARGLANVPADGPILLVSNHLSYADQYFIAVHLKRRLIFMAKEELFRFLPLRLLVEGFGAFPVRRGGLDRTAMMEAHRVLDSGLALAMFPEGSRSRDGKLREAFPGIALIAAHNRVPILPVAVTGLQGLEKMIVWWAFYRPRVTMTVGKPFYLPETAGRISKEERQALADYIMGHIAELLPPEYRGCYADKVRDDSKD
jgi:1-acyl-sn-glycerol-3-phosphate acyltransferase